MNRTAPSSLELGPRRVVGIAWVLQAAVLLVVGVTELWIHIPLLRPIVTVAYLTFVPGVLLVLALDLSPGNATRTLLYVFGLSLVSLMAVGAVTSLGYPLIGIQRPISVWPLMATLLVLVVSLGGFVLREREFMYSVPVGEFVAPLPLALLCLPMASILGTYVLVTAENNLPLLYLLGLISLVPIVVAIRNRHSRWYGLAIWCIAAALLWHNGLWPFDGGHPEFVMTLEEGRWLPNAIEGRGSLLPNTVLFPIYAVLSGFTEVAQWDVVNPFLVSFLPVALYEVYQSQISSTRSFLSTCLFMFSYPFYVLYPGAGRIATPVLFLALIGVVVTDDKLTEPSKAILTPVFGAGVVVAHYGTAYVVMFALFVGALVHLILGRLDLIYDLTYNQKFNISSIDFKRLFELQAGQAGIQLFKLPFLFFYATLAVAWYLYTARGLKFQQLPRKVVDAIYGVLHLEATGSAANVVTKQYGSQIVATTRVLYLLLGALMAIGFLYVLYSRFTGQKSLTTDQYYALAAGHFAMLGASALPSGTGFAVARVMMIVFVFAAPFAIFGVDGIQNILSAITSHLSVKNPTSKRVSVSFFALIIALFLLMNSGVTAELAQQDFAPSKKVSQERLVNSDNPYERSEVTQCRECNINTHIWLYSNANESIPAYGDEYVESQTDFYSSEIRAALGFNPSPSYYRKLWSARNGTDSPAYLVLLPRNLDSNGVYPTRYSWYQMNGLDRVYADSNLIYQSQETKIYYTEGNTTTTVDE